MALRDRLRKLEQQSLPAGTCRRCGLPVRQLQVVEVRPGESEPPADESDCCRCAVTRILFMAPADQLEDYDR